MFKKIIELYKCYGLSSVFKKIFLKLKKIFLNYYYNLKYFYEPEYKNPDDGELSIIEEKLKDESISLNYYSVNIDQFHQFKNKFIFPLDYCGGHDSPVYQEKLLEHFIAYDLLNLCQYSEKDTYIDVAASGSPWAKLLREHLKIDAYAIDLNIPVDYQNLNYYIKCDATKTSFASDSVSGLSLQCAFEMFQKNDDINFIAEIARILKSGGKVIIVPLYMHTQYCFYASPDHYKSYFAESEIKEYICRKHTDIYFSRKYDVKNLKTRIIDPIVKLGLNYKMYVLKNKKFTDSEIYCHFILEVSKP